MRTTTEIEVRMKAIKERFAVVYRDDVQDSIYLYQRYRELWWVLHPDVDDWEEVVKRVNVELGLTVES